MLIYFYNPYHYVLVQGNYCCGVLHVAVGKLRDVDQTFGVDAHIDEGRSNPGYFSDTSGLVTHIEAVPAKANTVKGIYTLDGRKLNELPTQKGIYIIDGRQVVIQ